MLRFKLKLLTACLLILPHQALLAQSAVIEWGDVIDLPKKTDNLGIVRNNAGYSFQFNHGDENLTVNVLDPQMHLSGEKQFPVSGLPDKYDCEALVKLGDRFYVFFSSFDRKNKKDQLYAMELYSAGGELTAVGTRKVSESDEILFYATKSNTYANGKTDKWHFSYAPDSSHLLVQYGPAGSSGEGEMKRSINGLEVFDRALNPLWKKKITMPYKDGKEDHKGFFPDKHGAVYCLIAVYAENRMFSKAGPVRHELYRWKAEEATKKFPVNVRGGFPTDVILKHEAGEMVVAGFYSARKNAEYPDGLFVYKPSGDSLVNWGKAVYAFDAGSLGEFAKDRQQKRSSMPGLAVGRTTLLCRGISFSRGSATVYGEEWYQDQYNDRTTSYVRNYFNDILVCRAGANGLQWITRIPKQQRGDNDPGLLSYHVFRNQVFFMDNPKNAELADNETEPKMHMDEFGGVLMAVALDDEGHFSKTMIYDVRDEGRNIDVHKLTPIDETSMQLSTEERKGTVQPGVLRVN